MSRTFSHVDHKVTEAEFFLTELKACDGNFFAIRCYVSAFSSSARSITFALQSSLSGVDGFDNWYKSRQKALRDDGVARFFHEFRRINEHVGDNLVGGGSSGPNGKTMHWFLPSQDVPWVPQADVETACHQYFVTILSLVYESYVDFGPEIDAHQRYTAEFFAKGGKTIEDAEEELGFPRGYTDIGRVDLDAYRWDLLRRHTPGCEINHIFGEYLGKTTPYPESPPPLENLEDGASEKSEPAKSLSVLPTWSPTMRDIIGAMLQNNSENEKNS